MSKTRENDQKRLIVYLSDFDNNRSTTKVKICVPKQAF